MLTMFHAANLLKHYSVFLPIIGSIMLVNQSHAQDVQLWMDGFVYKNFAKKGEYEGNVGVSKLLEKHGWGEIYFCNTVAWQASSWYGAEGSLELHYTNDHEASDIIEVRPWLAQKFTFTQLFKALRIEKPYVYMRLEQRFLFYPEQDTTDTKTRLRMRLGGRILLNINKLTDKTVYIPFFIENFFNFNGEAVERFASKNRVVIGVGYVFNSKWKAEFDHYIQRSRNTIDDEIEKTDVMLQFKVMHFLD